MLDAVLRSYGLSLVRGVFLGHLLAVFAGVVMGLARRRVRGVKIAFGAPRIARPGSGRANRGSPNDRVTAIHHSSDAGSARYGYLKPLPRWARRGNQEITRHVWRSDEPATVYEHGTKLVTLGSIF